MIFFMYQTVEEMTIKQARSLDCTCKGSSESSGEEMNTETIREITSIPDTQQQTVQISDCEDQEGKKTEEEGASPSLSSSQQEFSETEKVVGSPTMPSSQPSSSGEFVCLFV